MENKLLQMETKTFETEQSLIGCCLKGDAELEEKVLARIKSKDFLCNPKHRLIWKHLLKTHKAGTSCEISIFAAILTDDVLKEIGGRTYLAKCLFEAGTGGQCEQHCEILENRHTERQMFKLGIQTTEDFQVPTSDPGAKIDRTIKQIEKIRGGISNDDCHLLTPLFPEIIKEVDERESGLSKDKLKTGFPDLDNLLGGLADGDVIVIAGGPSQGKSQLALQICEDVSTRQDKKVLIISLEMSGKKLGGRILFGLAGVGYDKKCGQESLNPEDWVKLNSIKADNIIYNDNPNITVSGIRALLRAKKREGVRLVIIDYLQLIGNDERYENRQQEVSYLSRTIKKIAGELGLPIILLSQLSRRSDNGEPPRLSHLRESGSIEQDADVVLFCYHQEGSSEKKTPTKHFIIVGKNRDGALGSLEFLFQEGRWASLSRREEPSSSDALPIKEFV